MLVLSASEFCTNSRFGTSRIDTSEIRHACVTAYATPAPVVEYVSPAPVVAAPAPASVVHAALSRGVRTSWSTPPG